MLMFPPITEPKARLSVGWLSSSLVVSTLLLSLLLASPMNLVQAQQGLGGGGVFSSVQRKLRIRLLRNVRGQSLSKKSKKPVIRSEGSILTIASPTPKRLTGWFWQDESLQVSFNHNSPGMTNPCLHIAVNVEKERNNPIMTTTFASTCTVEKVEPWWPETASRAELTANNSNQKTAKADDWRVLSFQRCVGHGLDCYKAARDAALEWDFTSPRGDKGIRSVAPRERSPFAAQPYERQTNPLVQQIWWGPGRRLATFTATKLLPFLPKIYCVNPVHVVYDLVDQRGPAATYTSTAYATGAKHWIRGEERVTVALRDNGAVDVQILSFSKPGKSVAGRCVWPFLGKMQRNFFEEQMNALERSSAVDTRTEDTGSFPPGSIVHLKK